MTLGGLAKPFFFSPIVVCAPTCNATRTKTFHPASDDDEKVEPHMPTRAAAAARLHHRPARLNAGSRSNNGAAAKPVGLWSSGFRLTACEEIMEIVRKWERIWATTCVCVCYLVFHKSCYCYSSERGESRGLTGSDLRSRHDECRRGDLSK